MRCLRTQTGSAVRIRCSCTSCSEAHSSASRAVTRACQSRSVSPSTSRWPPLAQIAYAGGGPGRLIRWYCLRVRVVVGTNTAASPSSVSSPAAVSVR